MPRAVNGHTSGTLSSTGTASNSRDATLSPTLVVSQIIVIQSLFYVTYAITLLICDTTLGITSPTNSNHSLILDQIFNPRILNLGTSPGLVAAAGLLVAEVGASACAFVVLVGRAKRALDFSTTLFAMHLGCVVLYSKEFPGTLVWWIVNGGGVVAMTVVGEVFAKRQEIREMVAYQGVQSQSDVESQATTVELSDVDGIHPA